MGKAVKANELFKPKYQRTNTNLSGKGGMTFKSATLTQSLKSTGSFLARHLWVWPLLATILLAVIGVLVHNSIESTMKASLKSELQTLLNVETAMLRTWLVSQEGNAESLANNINVRSMTLTMLGEAPIIPTGAIQVDDEATEPVDDRDGDLVDPGSEEGIQSRFAKLLAPSLTAQDYMGFVLLDRAGEVIAASETELVGQKNIRAYIDWMTKVVDGEPTVSRPFLSVAAIQDGQGSRKTEVPTMLVAAPVRDNNFQVVACLALRIRPEKEFTRILQLGRIGESGETYAFDRHGVMISNSRFDEDLILLGLIKDTDDSRSLLQIQVRDPGGNMTEGFRPKVRRAEQSLTRMAESAVSGENEVDVEGYNDYRGVPVVGAWSWLPKYGFGVTTEEDVAEAYHPLTILKRAFWGLLLLLTAASVAIFAFTIIVARLQKKARETAIKAKKLGQYQLEQKLGEGAMGVVYRGKHAMLRRPTAIKLINSDKVSERAITGFEREVQITSQLNHPNTVAIYDFGRTPEGVFYYAMEFLDGIELQDLVAQYGPQEPARIIHIIEQVCRSLYEAHSHGLVHRDVKPANIMLNRRGGDSDVVKVLDFGLVQDREEMGAVTGVAGTPLYMSPESIQNPGSVDACSDIYSVGAVAWFLATGKPIFFANSTRELCNKQISEVPASPSDIVGAFPEDLESIIMSCLEKDRSKRPQTARDLARQLAACNDAGQWDSETADRWWAKHDRKTKGLAATQTAMANLPDPPNAGPDESRASQTDLKPLATQSIDSNKTVMESQINRTMGESVEEPDDDDSEPDDFSLTDEIDDL